MHWWQDVCVACGVVGLFGLVLVQPDEERKFRNVLVDWWVSVTATGETWTEKHAAVARAYAKKTLAVVQFVFGPRFGWCFVLGSLLLTQLAMLIGFTVAAVVHRLHVAPALGVIATQLVLLLLARLWRPRWPLVTYGVSWIILLAAGMFAKPDIAMLTFPVAMALGVLVDILVVSANQWVLQKTVNSRSKDSVLLLAAVIVLPLGLGWTLLQLAVQYRMLGAAILTVASYINIVFSCFSIGIALLFLINRAIWSVLWRIFATMHGSGPSRKQVLVASLTLIAFGLARQPAEWALKKAGLEDSVLAQPIKPENVTSATTAAGRPAR